MKIIEHRRHSMRDVGGKHLNQEGLNLARKVGMSFIEESFVKVVTSDKERAKQTAVAMGFAITELNEILSTIDEGVEKEISWDQMNFVNIKQVLEKKGALFDYTEKQKKYFLQLMNGIEDGEKILMVSHGGVLEFGLVAIFPDEDHISWGDNFDYCEGYRLFFEDNNFVKYELLRD